MRLRRTEHALRTATNLTGNRPAYAAGFRGALATIVPLIAAQVIGNAAAGTWMSLGGFNTALSDKGGAYRSRALLMLAVTGAGAVATIVGSLASGHTIIALVVTFVFAFISSSLRVFGNPGISIGSGALTVLILSLAIPVQSPREFLVRAGFLVAGSLWSLALALILWPLRPYRPAREAVANVYATLALFIRDVATIVEQRDTAEWSMQQPGPTNTSVRMALEDARSVLVELRLGRPGIVERGERLLVLADSADQIFGHVAALTDLLAALRADESHTPVYDACIAELEHAAQTSRELGRAILAEKGSAEIQVQWGGSRVRALNVAAADPQYEHAATILDRAAQFAGSAALSVAALNSGRDAADSPQPATVHASVVSMPNDPAYLDTWKSVFSQHSLIGQFALRVAFVTTIAVGLNDVFNIERGYWLTITVFVILQPYTGVTLTRAVQRVLGTVLGGLIAALLGSLFPEPRAIMIIATVFVACCVALLPVNYAAYSVFLTPTFVLLAEVASPNSELASVRVFNTLLGGALALAGSRLLWPSPEKRRFPSFAAMALRANAAYLDAVVTNFDEAAEAAGESMRYARRSAGLATMNAEESLQRALIEAHGDKRRLSSSLTVLAFTRRLTATVASLAISRHTSDRSQRAELEPFQQRIARILNGLADSLEHGSAAPALDRFDVPEVERITSLVARGRVERLLRQVRTLHDAVERINGRPVLQSS